MSDPRAVRISGPLAEHVDGFCAELGVLGYTRDSASIQLQLMAHVSRWLEAEGLVVEDLTPARRGAFLRARRAEGYRDLLSHRALVPLTGYLASVGVVSMVADQCSDPDGDLLGDYRRHLVVDRGLAGTTVAYYTKVAGECLAEWDLPDGRQVGALTAGDVKALVLRRCRAGSVASAKAVVTALRSWLRFLQAQGVVANDLAGAVPAVAGWRGGWVPRGLSDIELAALLDSVDVETVLGLRDRAVLMLLIRLGLRAREAAKLALDDVDWRQGEILISGKGSRQDRLPLPVDVGEALVCYVRDGRPRAASRTMFLRVLAPIVGLSPTGVSLIVRRASERAGVPAAAHRLRHSAATGMLRAGGSLSEVAQVLRHADVATSAIYAKVDHEALRTLALAWPGRAA
jgi:site-specific recombinase XerD